MEKKPPVKKPKRKAKDSVFIDLFGNKKYLLQLYQALHPEDTQAKEDDLTIVTIKNILTEGMYNDLGFLLGEKLIILVESQSKWTENILVRSLMYLMQTYYDYLVHTGQDIHSTKKVSLPKPELYMIYIGERKRRPEYISFSESYFGGQECCMDARVRIIYDGKDGDIISQYIVFCKVFKEQMKKYNQTHQAVIETVRRCKDQNVLREYLEGRGSEVISIMMKLFDDEEVLDMYVKSQRREAAEEAAEKAAIKTAIEIWQDFGLPKQDIAEKIKVKFHLSQMNVQEILEKYWQS